MKPEKQIRKWRRLLNHGRRASKIEKNKRKQEKQENEKQMRKWRRLVNHGRRASADSQNLHKQPASASFVLPRNHYYQMQKQVRVYHQVQVQHR